MPPSEPLALAAAWARKVLNTDPGGDGGLTLYKQWVHVEHGYGDGWFIDSEDECIIEIESA